MPRSQRPSPRLHRWCRTGPGPTLAPLVFVLLALALTGLPAAAAAQPAQGGEVTLTSLETSPGAATWRDRVTVTLRGTATCPVDLDVLTRRPDGPIRLELTSECPVPPPGPAVPFSVTATLDHLEPGEHPLWVERDGSLLAQESLEILRPGRLFVYPPPEPLPADQPVVLRMGGFVGCGFAQDVRFKILRAADGLVEVYFDLGCPILPAGFFDSAPVDLGILEPGSWEVRLYSGLELPENASFVVRETFRVHVADGCEATDTDLCLQDGRFLANAVWGDFQGGSGPARAVPLEGRDDTGAFWFFRPDNLELTVKVLDGCAVNGHHWVFIAPGSNAGWQVTVVDATTDPGDPDHSRTYDNYLGELPSLVADTAAFPCD